MREWLPRGRTLPEEDFRRRHRFLLGLLWAHAAVLPVWGVVQGNSVGHSLLEGGIIAGIALAATALGDNRKRAALLVSLGLLSSSAMLVHFSHGYIEAHFHFFVMIVLLTLYEDWSPFLLAAGYVVVHHGLGGVIDASAVYNHPAAVAHPWRWAGIHAAFVSAAGLSAIGAWRLNEDLREQKQRALERALLAEAEQERYAADLERSNRDLEQFAYVASHDLAEPLRTVSSFIGLLDQRYGGRLDAEAHEFIRSAVGGAQRMQSLIDDLLEYSRLGQARLISEAVSLEAVTADTLTSLQASIERTGARIEIGPLPIVNGDPRQLVQLFQNLVSNAMKFAAETPVIRIESLFDDGSWTVSVIDNGIGIDPAAAQRIFTPFERLHGRERFDGTGIGLAICERVVERHGGRIWVEPVEGGGSSFRFTLPAAVENGAGQAGPPAVTYVG
jgi:signal transduction histidine kinase